MFENDLDLGLRWDLLASAEGALEKKLKNPVGLFCCGMDDSTVDSEVVSPVADLEDDAVLLLPLEYTGSSRSGLEKKKKLVIAAFFC